MDGLIDWWGYVTNRKLSCCFSFESAQHRFTTLGLLTSGLPTNSTVWQPFCSTSSSSSASTRLKWTGSVTLVSLWPQCGLARSHWWVSGCSVDWLGHTGESQCCFLLRQCCLCSDQSSLSLISVILWRNGANFVGIVEISFSIGLVWAGFSVSHWRGLVQTSHVWDPSLASVCITRWTTLADWEKRRFVVENDVLRVYVADGDERKGKPEITRKTSIFYEESK